MDDLIGVVIIPNNGDGFMVHWKTAAGQLANVPVATAKQAERLKAQIEAGRDPARAIRQALGSRRRPSAKQVLQAAGRKSGKLGGQTRAKNLSPRKRQQIAQAAAAARWGKRKTEGDKL